MKLTMILISLLLLLLSNQGLGQGGDYLVRVTSLSSTPYDPMEPRQKAKSIEPLLSYWREFRDSCYADSSEVTCHPDPFGKPYKVWMHKDPNDLPAFMEFLNRRRLW